MDEKDRPEGVKNIEVAPEPTETVEPIVDTEIEPETVSTPTPAVAAPDNASERGSAKVLKSRRVIMVIVGVLLLAVAGAGMWWFTASSEDEQAVHGGEALSTSTGQPKLGVALTNVDGIVEYSRVNDQWQAAGVDTQLQEGDTVRTTTDSRAVLTLDDGSVIRLDASTAVELASLVADDVEVKQIEGVVYSRVVASERTYTVAIDDVNYEAVGTAFATIATPDEKGVQVYQSSVKVEGVEEAVDEGSQYYHASEESALENKITTLDIDTLADDSFLNWNVLEDEADVNFKLKLGVLLQIKQRSEEKKEQRRADAEARKKTEERKNAERSRPENERAARNTMTLSLDGDTLKWNYTGRAKHGYKLVYSTKSETPTLGIDSALHFSDPRATSGKLTKKNATGSGKYHVRVCAYVADDPEEQCVDYSNIVIVDL